MKLFAPTYYHKFHCIADKCNHSCCIGWEIDIDRDTYACYKKHNGILKDRFDKYIAVNDGIPHFILDKYERCPFLNSKKLCDIYTELGEESLCQICTDHPRFRNFYSGRTEIGLGICCEEACRIVLKETDDLLITEIDDDGASYMCSEDEAVFFRTRMKMFRTLCDKTKSFDERFEKIFNILGIRLAEIDYVKLFDGAEYMDRNVSEMIAHSGSIKICDIYLERLALYFIYRHLAGAFDDGLLCERAVFAYISANAIEKMCVTDSFEDILECARIYSSEIEYSEENTEKLLNRIGEYVEILV